MNTQFSRPIFTATAIFVALAIVFIALVTAAQRLPDPFSQTVMISIASAVFGSGLTFFLIRVTTSVEMRD